MVKQKTQTDYWNEGVKFAKEENWEAAIEKYKEAIALQSNPALYTNLAACYKKLNDLEKEKEYYLLAVPGLLNREYTYTSSPANSTAWWLFENDTDLENAEKISKIAIEIDANSAASLDTYVNILLKQNKLEEGVEYLTKLKVLFPEHEASFPLYEKYKIEIEKYIEKYWEEEDKEERARKILENYSYPKNEVDFILYGGKYNKTSNFYPYNVTATYKELKASFIGNDEDITKRFFKIIFKHNDIYYKGELINAITSNKKDDETYNKAVTTLKNAEIDAIAIISAMSGVDYSNEKTDYLLKLLNENYNDNGKNTSILDIIKKNAKNNVPKQVNFFSKFLLDKDYDKYVSKVNGIMENTLYYYDVSSYITLLKNDTEIVSFIVNKLKKYNNAQNKFDDEFFDGIKTFLETGVMNQELTDACNKVNSTYHYSSIYSYFVRGLNDKHKFYDKLLKISFLLDSHNTFNNMFNSDNKFSKKKIDSLVDLGMGLDKQLVSFLDKYSDTYAYNKDTWGKYLSEVIKRDFDAALEELDNIAKDKKKLSFLIPLMWKHDNDKFYPYLLKLSALASKQVKDSIIKCLKGYENGFDDFQTMLKSKKQGERIIGVELLASLNFHDKVVPILNELLKKEKAAKVKAAVDSYFKGIKAGEEKLRKENVLKFTVKDFNSEADANKDDNLKALKTIKWLDIDSLPKLKLENEDSDISINLTYSLLNSLTKSKGISLFYEAEKLLSYINKAELTAFSKALYEMWKSSNESTEWVLILLSVYYNDNKILDELLERLNKAVEDKKVSLLKAFTQNILLIGKNEGFRRIARLLNKNNNHNISQVYYDIGYKLNVGGLLNDLRMNTFGFDENANKTIDYGPRSFVLTMTRDFKFTVVADNGKSYKNLPKPSKKDDEAVANKAYEDFKNMKKDLKEYLKGRKSYLENKMVNGVSWDVEDWKMIFLENPVMNNFAKGLIWLVDSENKTFRIMEDNTYVDIEDEEYELATNSKISLVHPIDLSNEDIDAWKEQLEDYEIIQPLDQLNRTVFKPTEEQLKLSSIDEFVGFMALRISFKSKLMDKYSWSRGPAEDAGCYYSYQKYLSDGTMAQLAFMGECYGGYSDRFQEIWMGELSFYKNNKELKLKDISARILSEVYMEVKSLADSGSGYNKDYQDTAW